MSSSVLLSIPTLYELPLFIPAFSASATNRFVNLLTSSFNNESLTFVSLEN
jgi:hypothetical protein